jgi:RNA-binding protein
MACVPMDLGAPAPLATRQSGPRAHHGVPWYNSRMKLNEKQRRHLRGLGHALKVIVFIGKTGTSDAVVAETVRALNDHELIKVRATGMERETRDESLASLASRTKSELVGRIGHTAVLYRRHPERPRIVLPA